MNRHETEIKRTSIFCVCGMNGFAARDVCFQPKEIEKSFLLRDKYLIGRTNSEWNW